MKQIIDLKNAFGFTHVRFQLIIEKPLRALLLKFVVKPVGNDVHLTKKVVKIADNLKILGFGGSIPVKLLNIIITIFL